MQKPHFIPGLATVGFFLLIIPVAAVIVASLWLTVTAVQENVKFARGTDQILAIISTARDAAARDPHFGQQPNEDVIGDFIRLGQYTARPGNAWGGAIRATAVSPSVMRIEGDLPSRACRRLAVFFDKEASGVALQKMEAREGNSVWRQFYNAPNNPAGPGTLAIDVACGNSENASLALVVGLR